MNNNKQAKGKTYWIYGKHPVEAALKNPLRVVHRVLATKNAISEMQLNAATPASPNDIEKNLQAGAVHQGVAIEVSPLPELSIFDLKDSKILLVLDQVTDPHNVGAILRSSAAFGASAVIVQDKNSPEENSVLAKSASGALETVPLVKVINISRAMEDLKEMGFWCVGLDGTAKTLLSKAPKYEKTVLVLGAEGAGMRRLTLENCDLLVKVPINDSIESLNVSNAAAVALYELSRG